MPSTVAAGVCAATAIAVVPWAGAEPAADAKAEGDWKVVYGSVELGGQYRSLAVGDATHAWAFGNTDALNAEHTRIDRWDGDSWEPDAAPDGATVTPAIADASGPKDAWAGGLDSSSEFTMLHFDGEEWSV
ncbi:MAG: hypothetical protein ACRDXX_13220, partial [Stackebrandtia sp.]